MYLEFAPWVRLIFFTLIFLMRFILDKRKISVPRILEEGVSGCIAARGKAITKFLFYFVFNSVSGKERGFVFFNLSFRKD